MTLEESIKDLANSTINSENDWYSWRTINENKLPQGIHLPQGNQYKKNISLKNQLNKKLQSAENHEDKKELLKYYISTWGGIHGNSEEKMDEYTRSTDSEIIALGSNGIASWSKALCIRNPNNFAIFDARVSASLNALQIINNTKTPTLYPILTSRNKVVKAGINLFKKEAKIQKWQPADALTFYSNYLTLLENVAATIDKELHASKTTIEMLLFAKSEELIKKAFPNEKF